MSSVFLNNVTTILKNYREQAKLTQLELSLKLNISLRTYQRIESGASCPGLDVLVNLSRILGFKFSEIFKYENQISKEHEVLLQSSRLLEMTCEIGKIGGWELDVLENRLYWTKVTRQIHEVDSDYIPNLESGIQYYAEGYSRDTIRKSVHECFTSGKEFRHELQLITAKGNHLNVIASGQSEFINDRCVRIFGTFQDITAQKKNELSLITSRGEVFQ